MGKQPKKKTQTGGPVNTRPNGKAWKKSWGSDGPPADVKVRAMEQSAASKSKKKYKQ